MEYWITFWTIVCVTGFVSFAITVFAIIPLGFRDIFRLFRKLRER
ncbi:MAG: hypothetical protein R3D00_00160 [Bacteroidia bacterium]